MEILDCVLISYVNKICDQCMSPILVCHLNSSELSWAQRKLISSIWEHGKIILYFRNYQVSPKMLFFVKNNIFFKIINFITFFQNPLISGIYIYIKQWMYSYWKNTLWDCVQFMEKHLPMFWIKWRFWLLLKTVVSL